MGATYSQMFPPTPALTDKNLPSQEGKVFIVTGGASGVGYELSLILYQAGGKVYMAGRSEETAQQRISQIKSSVPSSSGELIYLPLDLSDLTSIKSSAESFKAKESRLDVLWNNAGVSLAPTGSVTKEGHDLVLGTNCLGPFVFTQLLLPVLRTTAQAPPQGSVRVVWTSSQVVDLSAPNGGIIMSELSSPPADKNRNYANSKTGNWFLASELARQIGDQGILSVTQNPGALKTNLLRHASWFLRTAVSPLLRHAKFGAFTELWAGLSPELSMEENGCYVIPWGRLHPSPRKDLLDALKSPEEGGTGRAREFWEWCERETEGFK